MEKFEPVNIDFIINSEEVKTETDRVKNEIKSVGQTAEQTAVKVDKQIKGAFDGGAQGVAATNAELLKQQQLLARAKPQWKGLGNSINQITRELPAFSLSAQTGFLEISNNIPILADEIGRLKTRNAALTASGQKAVPVWKQVVKGLLSWGTALSVGAVLLTVYGRDVLDFISKLIKGKESIDKFKESQEALNTAFDSANYKKVVKDVLHLKSTINLAKKGVIDKDTALQEYNKTLGDVIGKTNDFDVAATNVEKSTPAYVEAMLYRAAATAAVSEAAKQLVEDQKKINALEEDQKKANKKKSDANKAIKPSTKRQGRSVWALAAREATLISEELEGTKKKSKEHLTTLTTIAEKFREKAREIAKAAGLDIFGGAGGDGGNKGKTVSAYQKLLDKLAALDKEYSRKTFTKDEEEKQALKDKFETIRTLVQRFNADPKNKAQIIDLSNLDKLETKATESLTYRQTTENLKEELEQQKKLFEEFETYKKQFGIAAAEEEFKNKIGEAQSYYEYLKQQQKENKTAYTAVADDTATGAQIERVQLLNKQLQEAATEEKKLFNEQLVALQNYQKKRNILIEKYEADRKKLLAAGKTDEVAELYRQHKEELANLDDANIKKLQSYKELFRGIVGLSAKEVKQVLANAKKLMQALGISAELKAAIAKKIAEVEKLLSDTKLDNIYKYVQAITSLGEALNELGSSLGSSGLTNAGALLSGLGSSIGEILTIFDKNSTKTDKITAGISSAVKLIGVFTSAAQKRKEAEEAYYLSVIGFQNQYNLSLQEQIRLRSILDENVFIKDYEGRITDALASLRVANEEYQKALDNLINNGQVKVGQRNAVDWGNVGTAASSGAAVGAAVGSVVPVIGTVIGALVGGLAGAIGALFGGKKKKDVYASILAEYPELIERSENGLLQINKALAESLLANNLVNKETAQILQNILDWEKALEEARAQIKKVISELAGSLGTDLKAVLVDAFVSGENAAIKMGDTVEKVLENILSSLIFNTIFEKAFDDLERQMANSFDIGGDGTWVDDFARFFNAATGLTDDFNTAMAAAQAEAANFGFDVFSPTNTANQQGLSGAIRRELTEETGSELTGLFRNQYDVTKRMFEITEEYYDKERGHRLSILNLIAINTNIEKNTQNTVEQLKLAVVELKEINNYSREHYYLDYNG